MRAALDPNGADAYWAGRFGLIPLVSSFPTRQRRVRSVLRPRCAGAVDHRSILFSLLPGSSSASRVVITTHTAGASPLPTKPEPRSRAIVGFSLGSLRLESLSC